MVIPKKAKDGSPEASVRLTYGDAHCSCGGPAEIVIHGYGGTDGGQEEDHNIYLCRHDALQLARKLLEDLCEIDGDRHG